MIDIDLIRTLASYDCSYEEIATACKCDPSTLTRRYKGVIEEGRREGACSLKRSIFLNATRHNNTTAQIFLMKARCGYSDKHQIDLAIQPQVHVIHYGANKPLTWEEEMKINPVQAGEKVASSLY